MPHTEDFTNAVACAPRKPRMSIAHLTLVLGAILFLRACFLLVMLRDVGAFWSDLERRGVLFQAARWFSHLTLLAFVACAIYALWKLDVRTASWLSRLGLVFIAWFGAALLSRLRLQAFPRTNSPQLFAEAKVDLLVHLIVSLFSGLGMTVLSAVYFWWRGR